MTGPAPVLVLVTGPAPVLMLRRARERWGEAIDRLHELTAPADQVAYADQLTAIADCQAAYEMVEDEVVALRALMSYGYLRGQSLAARMVRPIDLVRGANWVG